MPLKSLQRRVEGEICTRVVWSSRDCEVDHIYDIHNSTWLLTSLGWIALFESLPLEEFALSHFVHTATRGIMRGWEPLALSPAKHPLPRSCSCQLISASFTGLTGSSPLLLLEHDTPSLEGDCLQLFGAVQASTKLPKTWRVLLRFVRKSGPIAMVGKKSI